MKNYQRKSVSYVYIVCDMFQYKFNFESFYNIVLSDKNGYVMSNSVREPISVYALL